MEPSELAARGCGGEPPRPQRIPTAAVHPWLNRFGRDLRVVLDNEIATRHVLASEVYRVPEAWLDDVLRVRMADL